MEPSAFQLDPVAGGMAAVCSLSLVFALLFVTGRVLSNLCACGRLYHDDFACIVGVLLFVAYIGVCIGVDYFDRHTAALAASDAVGQTYLKLVFNAEFLYGLTSGAAKLSVLLLYLRIFSTSRMLRWAVCLASTAAALLSLASMSVFTVYCGPRDDPPTGSVPELVQMCAGASTFALAQQAIGTALDLLMVSLPVVAVLCLRVSLQHRLDILCVCSHGVFAALASAVGIYYRIGLLRGAVPGLWWRSAAFECGVVEICMMLASGSMYACMGYIRNSCARIAARELAERRALSIETHRSSRAFDDGHGCGQLIVCQEQVFSECALAQGAMEGSLERWVSISAPECGEWIVGSSDPEKVTTALQCERLDSLDP